ncbi:MAG: hypothetical protein H6736_22320 [Alphaproteobacteria bacterium]|nr:hypothetical protein [Alphaproteobacteria bacterium]MCB9694554.1 hypothetical protein [Alphaproteobacteria bacterium]
MGPHVQPLRTWLAHALTVGAGVGLLFPVTLVVTVMALDPNSQPPKKALLQLQLAAPLTSMVVAGLTAVPAALTTRLSWRFGAGPTMALGVLLGGLGAIGMWVGMELILEPNRGIELRPLPWIALAGAAGVGPPWVAYMAVLARGRGAWPVTLATPIWAMGAVATAIVFLWLRIKFGYDR